MFELTIGRAAKQAGVGVETIRFYERRGLIEQPPKPSGKGYRRYPAQTIQRLRFIRRAQHLGFSLREIKELLDLRARPAATCPDMRQRARVKLAEIDRKISELTSIRQELGSAVEACPGTNDLSACTVVAALEER